MASIRQAVQLFVKNEGISPGEFFEKKIDEKSVSHPDGDVNFIDEGDLK
jgi:hypothetical protein